jgi:CubicO group peptidase (beta-lactamase class C family)
MFLKKCFIPLITLASCLFLFTACEKVAPIPIPDETPQFSYAIDSLSEQGSNPYKINNTKIKRLVNLIKLGFYGDIHSLIIIQNNELVREEYFSEWTRHMLHPCYSATKSVVSTLMGMAIDEGAINSVDEEILPFFPEYPVIENMDSRKDAISIENVLTMTAGLEWNELNVPYIDSNGNWNLENDAVRMMFEASDWVKYVLDRPMQKNPGEEFTYSTGYSMLLSGIITNATGSSLEEYAQENLFGPMGITHWYWETTPTGVSNGGSGLYLHPVNMAMFGYLCLKSGNFDYQQVIPADWLHESAKKRVTIEDIQWPFKGKFDYGYHWWRLNDSYFDTFAKNVPIEENDIYYAFGLGGQMIFVVPHLDMVVTMTSWTPNEPWLQYLAFNSVLSAVKER